MSVCLKVHMLKGDKFYITLQKISLMYFERVGATRHGVAQCVANPATACKQNVLR